MQDASAVQDASPARNATVQDTGNDAAVADGSAPSSFANIWPDAGPGC